MGTATHSLSLFDERPFFEKALAYGLEQGILGPAQLDSICAQAPKGMVQIARYFGTEFLRPELELARVRLVNLVSLYLQVSCQDDLRRAAESLRDHSLLSRSKGGSDLLKTLIAMPQNSHFGMHEEESGFQDAQIPLLAKWSLRSCAEYQSELAARQRVDQVVNAAVWLAQTLGLERSDLQEASADAEAVIRSALLARACKRSTMPDWADMEKMLATLRRKYRDAAVPPSTLLSVPPDLPQAYRAVVESVRQSVADDWPRLLDGTLSARKLLAQTPSFLGRYFWLEDALADVDDFERSLSAEWDKRCGGHADDASLLTLFLSLASASPPRTLLTEKSAKTLVRKIRKTSLQANLARDFIALHAPHQHQAAYARLWDDFLDEAQATLESDRDPTLHDAMALLRRECCISS